MLLHGVPGRVLGGLLAAASALGCAAEVDDGAPGEAIGSRGDAIQGGYGDVDDAAVLGLVVSDSEGNPMRTCTATLIAPNLVLTAQHCLAQTSKFVECDSAVFGPPVEPSRVFVTTGTSMWATGTEWRSVRTIFTPSGIPKVCGRDMALMILTQTIPDAEATPIAPRLDRWVEPAE